MVSGEKCIICPSLILSQSHRIKWKDEDEALVIVSLATSKIVTKKTGLA